MKIILFIFALFISSNAIAASTFIDESGNITVSGKVMYVGNEDFSIVVNDEQIEIQMDQINDETIEYLTDNNIVKKGSFVKVYGELGDGIGGNQVIKAETIQLY